jgi:hypothetical protein
VIILHSQSALSAFTSPSKARKSSCLVWTHALTSCSTSSHSFRSPPPAPATRSFLSVDKTSRFAESAFDDWASGEARSAVSDVGRRARFWRRDWTCRWVDKGREDIGREGDVRYDSFISRGQLGRQEGGFDGRSERSFLFGFEKLSPRRESRPSDLALANE